MKNIASWPGRARAIENLCERRNCPRASPTIARRLPRRTRPHRRGQRLQLDRRTEASPTSHHHRSILLAGGVDQSSINQGQRLGVTLPRRATPQSKPRHRPHPLAGPDVLPESIAKVHLRTAAEVLQSHVIRSRPGGESLPRPGRLAVCHNPRSRHRGGVVPRVRPAAIWKNSPPACSTARSAREEVPLRLQQFADNRAWR